MINRCKTKKKVHKKGIELPINTLVVVAIAVIILLAVAGFFMGVWTPSAGGMQALAAKNQACGQLMNIGCADATIADMQNIPFNYDIEGDGSTSNDNLEKYCRKQFGSADTLKKCKQMCGCPGFSGDIGKVTTTCFLEGGECLSEGLCVADSRNVLGVFDCSTGKECCEK